MIAGALRPLMYCGLIVASGLAVIAYSVMSVVREGTSYEWLILAYLTVLTGAFTIRIPKANSKFSVSDMFIFINMILFGTAAGVLTGVLDGLVGSLRCRTAKNRKYSVPFNMATLALSVFAGGQVFYRMADGPLLSRGGSGGLMELALPVIASGLTYYVANSLLVAWMLGLESGGSALRLWSRSLFTTAGITLVGVAAGASFASSVRSITSETLLIVVPVLVTIYFLNTIWLRPELPDSAGADFNTLSVAHRPAYRRFHYFMVTLGLGFVALLAHSVVKEGLPYPWITVAGMAVVAGFVTVRMPGVNIKFSLADIFVFANTILFGPVAGAITAALDGLAGSLRTKSKARRWEFTLFNVGGLCLSAYVAGELFFRISGRQPGYDLSLALTHVFVPTVLLAVSYYLLNTMAVALIVALQEHRNVIRIWLQNMGWGLMNCVACALGAVLVSAEIAALTPSAGTAVFIFLLLSYITLKSVGDALSGRQVC